MRSMMLWLFGLLFSFIIIAGIVATSQFFTYRSQGDSARQFVDYQIERNGGLTPTAMNTINDYLEKRYGNRFEVKSLDGSDKYPYGTVVDYQIQAPQRVLLLGIPMKPIVINGSGISLIKGE